MIINKIQKYKENDKIINKYKKISDNNIKFIVLLLFFVCLFKKRITVYIMNSVFLIKYVIKKYNTIIKIKAKEMIDNIIITLSTNFEKGINSRVILIIIIKKKSKNAKITKE